MDKDLPAVRGQHVGDGLRGRGAPDHLQHDGPAAEEKVGQARGLAAVDLGRGDPVGDQREA